MTRPPKAYRVVQWDSVHETHESRKYKFMNWFPKPSKHDGIGFRRMQMDPRRVELYCAWNLILDVASRGRVGMRGWLLRGAEPLDAEEVAFMTGYPKEIFEAAFKFFCEGKHAWLAHEELPGDFLQPAAPPGDSPGKKPDSAKPAAPPGDSPRTDRETDIQTNKHSTEDKNRGGCAPSADVLRMQFAALSSQIAGLERQKKDGELDAAGKAELREKKALLKKVQDQQARGGIK